LERKKFKSNQAFAGYSIELIKVFYREVAFQIENGYS